MTFERVQRKRSQFCSILLTTVTAQTGIFFMEGVLEYEEYYMNYSRCSSNILDVLLYYMVTLINF